ncbi:hypothetical protein RUND412_010273 [Rhizina undulata]
MSSQDSGIPFSYTRSQAPIRLLELPPALLSLVTADSPPVLKIKAAPTPHESTGPSSSSTTNHAVLCTPTQTFALREVRSSNSIFLVQPSPSRQCEDAFSPPPTPGVTIVSTTHAYLELIPATPDPGPLLEKRLIAYHGWEDEDGDTKMAVDPMGSGGGKEELRDDIPVSDAEFEAAWHELLAFDFSGSLYRPTPKAILKTLEVVFTSAAAESFSLFSPFTIPELMAAIDEPDVPRELVSVLMRRVCDETNFDNGGGDGKWILNKSKCSGFVGRKILEGQEQQTREDKKKKNDLLNASFMFKWKEAVPEECRGECKLNCLKGYYTHPTPSTIRCVIGERRDEEVAAGAASLPSKNKWHEKFRKAKK